MKLMPVAGASGEDIFSKYQKLREGENMRTNLISTMCVVSLLWFGTANANLITNGNFNDGLTSWRTAGDVTIQNTGFGTVAGLDGNYAALGFETEAGTNRLTQLIDITNYNSIMVSFDWVFQYEVGTQKSQDVFVSFLFDKDKTTTDYKFNREVTGKAETNGLVTTFGTFSEIFDVSYFNTLKDTRLRFQLTEKTGDTYSRVGIDNVSVQPVPEPASLLLVGTGLVGLVALGRRKAKKEKTLHNNF